MKRFLAVLLLPAMALAQTTYIVTDPGWTLNGTVYATQAACIAVAEALSPPAPGATAKSTCTDITAITAATPLPPPSANGTYLAGPTSTAQLTDAAGTIWTLNAGIVYDMPIGTFSGVKAGYTAGVTLLLWFNGAIHQRNPACLWWAWNGTAWFTESAPAATVPACATVSASGTVITAAGQSITDAAFNTWTLAAGVVMEAPQGGTPAAVGFSANVIALAYVAGVIYQENASCQWYSWKATATPPWAPGAPPTPVAAPTCPASGPPVAFGVHACGNKLCSTLDQSPVVLIGGMIQGCEANFAPTRCAVIANQTVSFWQSTWKAQHPGTNTARIDIDACSYLNDTACAPGTDGKNASEVQQAIANMTAAGLYVIVDLIQSAPAGQKSIGQPGFADATHAPAFWKSFSDKYGKQPNVVFELFNEPFGENVYADWEASDGGKDVAIVASGGSYSPFMQQNNSNNNALVTVNVSYQVEGELQMLSLIRAEGATNLVLASPTGWAGEIENWLASYNVAGNPDPLKNFGVSQHAYGYNMGSAPITAVLTAGYPIVETEFQVAVGNIGTAASVLSLGISGELACCPNAWNGTSVVFEFGYGPTYTTTW
jgi:Cellulase (glycosyl hydrolase family 5)